MSGLSATVVSVLNYIVVHRKKQRKNNSHLVDYYLRITKRNYVWRVGGAVDLKAFDIQQSNNWDLIDPFPLLSCLLKKKLENKLKLS